MASTPPRGRTPNAVNRASMSRPQLRVRWDRVSVLVALVAVLATVVAHTVVVAVRNNVKPAEAMPARVEAAATVHPAAPAVNRQPTCPRRSPGVVRTAPIGNGQAGEAQPTVALTFDDGPGPSTPEVLNVLQQNGVPATFFVIGQNAAAEPEMLQKIVAAGNVIGDHTWSHHIPSAKAGWKASTLKKEIDHTRRAIKGAAGVTHAAGLSMILWSVDTRDWAAPPNKKFAPIIQKRAAAGLEQKHPVILLHDGGGNRVATVAALVGIINDYRSHGYRFVTLEEPR
jgi:peptidoglycan/xylan/chitin deacetylase (PgdA/CDA1 family)